MPIKNMTNLETLRFYLQAKTPCIWIHSYEEARVVDDLKTICFQEEYAAQVWSITEGLVQLQITNRHAKKPANTDLKNPDLLLGHIKEVIEDKHVGDTLWVLRDANKALTQMPFLYRHIRDIKEYNKGDAYHPIVIISTESRIPDELDKLFSFIDYETMNHEEILDITRRMNEAAIEKYPENPAADEATIKSVAQNLGGLTFIEIVGILKRAIIAKHSIDLKYVMAEKIKLIQKTEVLEYKVPEANFDFIGGNENFKNWVDTLEVAMEPEAQEFGCTMPKGYVSVGIPGTAKSYLAEALANRLNIPYIEFAIARVV